MTRRRSPAKVVGTDPPVAAIPVQGVGGRVLIAVRGHDTWHMLGSVGRDGKLSAPPEDFEFDDRLRRHLDVQMAKLD